MMTDFEIWWHQEGSKPPPEGIDMEEHCRRMCEIAWKNGGYKAIWVSATFPPQNDDPCLVTVVARYKHYKPQSQQAKAGIVGRWQLHNAYGWNNTDIEIVEYKPMERKS